MAESFRCAILHTPYKLVTPNTWATLEDAVRAMNEIDRANIFTTIERKNPETGRYEEVPDHEYIGLKIRLLDERIRTTRR
ncbi:hypothetical protein PBI_WOES_77 [Gordonia phage Woes]|uniref:Uncharacterized protein n=11 Tax=Woesvirus woes TaxID=1982751 RepID=A0A482JJE2_9CAUD|nr:hypothetical protein BH793_gp36 [Gordonia phage Woes]ATW61172.1 hypothetical protein SEA_ANAMIKA_77 [Gordonia phage Anamika]AVP43261.1 hypothetical protein PBI_HAIL2PITT_76 [Gordonia phage Hail2Pitt]QAX94360.1 hypothetical protein SEA_GUILLAUME_77 [Gordonia phage Guillaume]QAX94683.1 hypothetical protein SEA_HARAMBE_77 [Gordonia phage Harambe]QAX95346.1 hypothetical protein SEA_HELLO_77 [Gordonia phage Hello]QAX95438.1 hypothetical protein SEA_NEOEVIE_77 [Gordonia phage Neoevie]QBP30354.1